jgi:hypothetical protein
VKVDISIDLDDLSPVCISDLVEEELRKLIREKLRDALKDERAKLSKLITEHKDAAIEGIMRKLG